MAPHNDRIPGEILDAAVELIGSAGRRGRIPVVGESMLPLLRPGQLLDVDFATTTLTLGDVAVFRNPAPASAGAERPPLIVHRYLGPTRFDDGSVALRFRGDGVPWLDPKIAPDDVLGRVEGFGDEDGSWWRLSGKGARLWARLIAIHDLFWSMAATAARRVDRGSAAIGGPRWTIRAVTALDRGLLASSHRVLFRFFHRRSARPSSSGESR